MEPLRAMDSIDLEVLKTRAAWLDAGWRGAAAGPTLHLWHSKEHT
jgi:hypothetical protein